MNRNEDCYQDFIDKSPFSKFMVGNISSEAWHFNSDHRVSPKLYKVGNVVNKGLHDIFLNNTNLTFLSFLYTIDIKGFQQKLKLPLVGIELTTPTITGLEF